MAGMSRRAGLVCALCATGALAVPYTSKKRTDAHTAITLPHHSFTAPMEYKTLLADWVVSGASLFERERLLVNPGVSNLAGFAWNKWPLLTADFEAVFQFRVSGNQDPSKVPVDQAFGFYYVRENITQSFDENAVIKAENWQMGLQAQGFELAGMKNRFDGIGAVLSVSSTKKPTISLLTSDGSSALDAAKDVPSVNSKEIDFRNTLNAATLKFRVKDKMVEGFLKQSPSLAWQAVFKHELPQPIQPGGFMGFSAWSGSNSSDGSTTPDLISITELEINNYDDTSIGEDMKDISVQIQEAYRDMLTDEHRHFLDQKSQTEHLTRLASMLKDHTDTAKQEEDNLYNQIQVLTTRLTTLGEQCRELKQETRLLIEGPGDKKNGRSEGIAALKDEIVGLRQIFQKDSATHKQKMDAVAKNVKEVSTKNQAQSGGKQKLLDIATQTQKLEKTVRSRGSQLTLMMFFLVVAVIGIGFLMWTRMIHYEKKHFI